MRVVKDKEHGLLTSVYGLQDRYHLAVSTLLFFDLDQPDLLLPEKELWPLVKKELPQGQALDPGWPKPHGEVLVSGRASAPKGETRPVMNVHFRVGELKKTLTVFGRRFWLDQSRFTEPEPFSQVPLTYAQAYGGQGFEKNPAGLGFGEITLNSEHAYHPLPLIENPEKLITSKEEKADPAGFMPIPPDRPQRKVKAGTFGQDWVTRSWPFYPSDFDPAFFNAAPEDQWLEGYFKGNESIELGGMHPQDLMIRSKLPGRRIRCFIVKRHIHNFEPIDHFEEIPTRIDTIWLLPTAKRGVIIFRGVTSALDDEAGDVSRLFLATEKLTDPPQEAEYYQDVLAKRLDRTLDIDQAPFDQAKEKIAKAMERIQAIPLKVAKKQARSLGRAPVMPRSPAEKAAAAQAQVAKTEALVTRMETMAAGMKARFGAAADVGSGALARVRQQMGKVSARIEKTQAQAEQQIAKAAKAKGVIQKTLTNRAEQLKATGAAVDPDILLLGPSEERWKKQAFDFIVSCRRHLEAQPDLRGRLMALGLSSATIKDAFFGFNPEPARMDATSWGLPDQPPLENIPVGLVIPRFPGRRPDRIVIRPEDFLDASMDLEVPGSQPFPQAVWIEDGKAILIVPDVLDAWLIYQEAGDLTGALALNSPGDAPDDDTSALLEKTPALLIAWPAQPSSEEKKAWADWLAAFPRARQLVLPQGHGPLEARKAGVDLRNLIYQALPDTVRENLPPEQKKIKAEDVKPGLTLPKIDVAGLIGSFKKTAAAQTALIKDQALAMKNQALAQAEGPARKAGLDLSQALAQAEGFKVKDPFDPSPALAALAQTKNKLKAGGKLTPKAAQQIADQEKALVQDAAKWKGQYQAGLAKLEAAKAKAQSPIPEGLQNMRKARGLDPQTGAKPTRDQILELKRQGASLKGFDLSGLDLSELDLSGLDFSQSNCQKTRFAGSNLDRAILDKTLAKEADFTGCSLKETKLTMSLFVKTKFNQADLSRADLSQSLFQEADLTGAILQGALMRLALFQKANLSRTDFRGARAERVVMQKSDLTGADFSQADLTKAAFISMCLTEAIFAGCQARSATLMGATGENLDFSGANLDGFRIIKGSSLMAPLFKDCHFGRACFMNSEIKKADFRGSSFDKALIQNCDLSESTFVRVQAPQTRITKSDLTKADLKGVNLMLGSLRKSRLIQTDLTGSNLFGVDFFKIVVNQTQFRLANLKRTQLQHRTDLIE